MNKYSQPINAPFVPTYAPPNLGVVSQVSGDLQKQRDLSLLQHDKLEEQFVSAMGEVMEADKPMLEKQLMEMNTAFDEIHNADTFQDAKPAIRKRAMQFAKDSVSGNLYKAKKNKQNMIESFKNIDGAKIPPEYKNMLKNGLISNYKGVLEGGVISEISNLPDYVNEADKAVEYAKDIRPSIYQELGMLPQTIMVDGEPKTIYTDIEGKVTRNQKQGIATIVKNRMMGDNELMSYLSLEASLERPDDVNGYIEEKLNKAAFLAVASQGSMQETFTTLPKGTRTTGSSDSNTSYVNLPGVIIGDTLIKDGFDNYIDSLRDAYLKKEDEPELFETKKSILHMALSKMVKLGDKSPKYGISVDDMDYYIKTISDNEYSNVKSTGVKDTNTYFGVGKETKYLTRIEEEKKHREALTQKDERFSKIHDKLSSYIDESGDKVGNSIQLTDDAKKKSFTNRFLDAANSRSMEIVNFNGGPTEEAELLHKIKSKINPTNNTPKISFNSEGVYYEVTYFDENEGEQTYLLQEKVQGESFGDQAWRENNLTNHVANIVGGNEGKWLNTTFALRGLKAYTGKNLIPKAGQAREGEHLPPNFSRNVRMMDGSQATYLELNEDGNGTTIIIGGNKNNPIKPFSYVDYITSIAPDKYNGGSPNDFRNEIYRIQDEHNIFTKGEMDYMLSSGNLSEESLKKILTSEALKQAYPFKDKIEAVSYVTSN